LRQSRAGTILCARRPANGRVRNRTGTVTPTRRTLDALLAAIALAAAVAVPVSGSVRAVAQDAATLRVATEGAYPPFNYVDTADNQLKGFEIELAKAMCERMRVTCDFIIADWDTMIRDLRRGQFDAIVASLEITEERRQKIAFGKPYYRTPAVFMARKDTGLKDITPQALKGRRLGAMTGTVYAAYLEDHYADGSEVKLYANQDEASLDLALGRIDAVLGDKIALQEWLKRGREASCCSFLADAPADVTAFGEGYGVGLRKEDEKLRQRFDAALDDIIADGTYDSIRARYFPFDVR
jgi:lysine-arginine-ornithine-binding protein